MTVISLLLHDIRQLWFSLCLWPLTLTLQAGGLKDTLRKERCSQLSSHHGLPSRVLFRKNWVGSHVTQNRVIQSSGELVPKRHKSQAPQRGQHGLSGPEVNTSREIRFAREKKQPKRLLVGD